VTVGMELVTQKLSNTARSPPRVNLPLQANNIHGLVRGLNPAVLDTMGCLWPAGIQTS
jgi:hypothetical protein